MLRDPSAIPQMLRNVSHGLPLRLRISDVHWVDGPEDEGEAGNSAEESGGLLILALDDATTVESKLIDDNQVGNAGHGVPAPLGSLLHGKGSKETGQDHDNISDNRDENVGTTKTSQKAKIEEQKWGGDAPVDITSPVDFTVDRLESVGKMFLGLLDGDLIVADAIIDCHGEVRDGSKGGDESSQNVEQAFLL